MSKPTLRNTLEAPPRCSKQEQRFCATVWQYYVTDGRHYLPWRKTTNPYRILVSEVMLQQTQVDRVIPKYQAFLKQFPTVTKLAEASLGDVLKAWQGLGYNRRAKLLWQCAKAVVNEYGGRFPKTYDGLKLLPGIGPYTAGAVLAFAYNEAVPLIETNVRTVYLHHFWPSDATDVTDKEILARVTKTLPKAHAREWYAALMDYGSYLKKTVGNHNARTKNYQKQSTFKGSDRQLRGAILRSLVSGQKSRATLLTELHSFSDLQVDVQLVKLKAEALIEVCGQQYRLPTL
jgi:A/G-specific adenine glycosylase